jgi:hypothetical protein
MTLIFWLMALLTMFLVLFQLSAWNLAAKIDFFKKKFRKCKKMYFHVTVQQKCRMLFELCRAEIKYCS